MLAIAMLVTITINAAGQDTALQRELVKAQIENQRTQAAYYSSEVKGKGIGNVLSNVIGSVIGAFIALAGVLLSSVRQSRLESEKWARTRQEKITNEIRLAVAQLTRKLSIATQAMQWTTWSPQNDPDNATQESLTEYDERMKVLWPDIVSASINIATLNISIYHQIMPLIHKVSNLDKQMFFASRQFKENREEGIKALAACRNQVIAFNTEYVNAIADILNLDKIQLKRTAEG